MRTTVFFDSALLPYLLAFGAIVFVISFVIWVSCCDTRSLPQKFADLGNLIGMPLNEIITKVGMPQETATDANGDLLCAWFNNTYAITLGFVDNKCVGVIREQTFTP